MSSKVKITEIPGCGFGLLAINDLKAGDLILRGLFKFLKLESSSSQSAINVKTNSCKGKVQNKKKN